MSREAHHEREYNSNKVKRQSKLEKETISASDEFLDEFLATNHLNNIKPKKKEKNVRLNSESTHKGRAKERRKILKTEKKDFIGTKPEYLGKLESFKQETILNIQTKQR